MYAIFLCTFGHTYIHTHSPGASHTYSHVQTRTRAAAHPAPTSGFCWSGRTGKVAGKAWTLHYPPPPHLSRLRSCLMQEVGQGRRRHKGSRPSLSLPTPWLVRLPLPRPPLFWTKLFLPTSPRQPPPPVSADCFWNSELNPHPPQDAGREAELPKKTEGRGLAGAPGPAEGRGEGACR